MATVRSHSQIAHHQVSLQLQGSTFLTLAILVIAVSSLRKTLDREKTQDKDNARRILDDELASIASKEYNPYSLRLREPDLN